LEDLVILKDNVDLACTLELDWMLNEFGRRWLAARPDCMQLSLARNPEHEGYPSREVQQ
jgi:hypothetical protein